MLGDMISGKRISRVGYGSKERKEVLRAGYGPKGSLIIPSHPLTNFEKQTYY